MTSLGITVVQRDTRSPPRYQNNRPVLGQHAALR
jgi:hypothetical protein